jgi:O-antigen/teichoic acid export membrane protein
MNSFLQRALSLVGKLAVLRGGSGVQVDSFQRYRGIIVGGVFAGLSKLIGLVTVAISVPITVKYLGTERYGMWMTISSLIAVLSFADLGIGNGLVSALASSHGRRETDTMVRLISSTFFMLVALAIIVLLLFLCSYPLVRWERVFGATTAQAVAEAGPSVLAFVACFALGLPFTLVQRTQLGLQESWRASVWQSGASVLSLVGVVVAAENHAGVVWLVVAMNGGTTFTGVLNTVVEFGFRKPQLRPKWHMYSTGFARRLLGTGSAFVILQLCIVLGTASDSIIIAQIFGAAAVGAYAVTYRLFQTSLIFGLFMSPLWPALGEALGRGDYAWAQRALNRAIFLSVSLGAVLALGLLFFGRPLIHIWVGGAIVPDLLMISSFAVCIIVVAYGAPLTSLLNNSEFLGIQLKLYTLASAAALGLKFPIAHWVGPSGVVWATVITYSLLYCLPARVVIRRYFRNAR